MNKSKFYFTEVFATLLKDGYNWALDYMYVPSEILASDPTPSPLKFPMTFLFSGTTQW